MIRILTKIGAPLIICLMLIGVGQVSAGVREHLVYSSLDELSHDANDAMINSITTTDSISILLNELVVSDKYSNKNRIVEIKCELISSNNEKHSFSTVQRALIRKNEHQLLIDKNFQLIMPNQQLSNVEFINIELSIRPIEDESAELFEKVAGFLVSAVGGNSILEHSKSIFKTDDDFKVIEYSAKFYIPSDFVSYKNISKSGTAIPVFKPGQEIDIVFSDNESVMSKKFLKQLGYMITNNGEFKDKNKVTAYAKITPTKLMLRQVKENIRTLLYKSHKILQSQKQNKAELAEEILEEAETISATLYKEGSYEMANIDLFIRLARLYSTYEGGNRTKLAKQYAFWLRTSSTEYASNGMSVAYVEDYFNKGASASFYFPAMMDNNVLNAILNMQLMFHIAFKELDLNKDKDLIKSIYSPLPKSIVQSH